MKFKVYASILSLVFLAIACLTGCSSNSSSAVVVAVTGGNSQSAQINQPYATPLQVTVAATSNGLPVTGASVTFTVVPAANGASGTFTGGVTTDTETTDSNGVATTALTLTANATAGGFTVTVTTTVPTMTPASFSLTNTAVPTFAFYLSGLETVNDGPNFYALAGSVAIAANGNVTGGEQDYNDGYGLTSPQPTGDAILPGTAALVVDPTTGQGTLTLTTNNTALGVSGVETLGVQFVNNNHALITQFDGSATSSGSLDLQTPGAPSGSYAFTLSGVDAYYDPVAYGGVFTIDATGTTLHGVYDVNDYGDVWGGFIFPNGIAISAPDAYGRGTITGIGLNEPDIGPSTTVANLSYYIVGPEAIRIIDVDTTPVDDNTYYDTAVGSAFGQGTAAGTFNSGSLGNAVFGIEGNSSEEFSYAAAGQLVATPDPTPTGVNGPTGTLTGVGDDNEEGVVVSAAISGGTYSVAGYPDVEFGGTPVNGYGWMDLPLGDIYYLGLYMTDPALNLLDPNNTTSGMGGALIADMDSSILAGGTGVLVPQTDVTPGDFTGNYAFGAQGFDTNDNFWEFDLVGQGAVAPDATVATNLDLTGTGLLSDPGGWFAAAGENLNVSFAGTATPDTGNVGRLTMLSTDTADYPLTVTVGDNTSVPINTVIYQASASQLFWVDVDTNEDPTTDVFLGTLQQQGDLSQLPVSAARKAAAKKAAAKTKLKHKQ